MYIFCTILGLLFLSWDLKKSNKFKLIFASSFLFSAIVAYKFPENYLYLASSLFIFSFLSYILINMILKKEKKDQEKNRITKNYIGKTAIVKKDIGKTLSIDGLGLIEFENKLWSAKSVDDKEIKAGNKVEIISKENLIMNVKVK